MGRPQSVAASSTSELTRGFRRYRAAQLPAAQQSKNMVPVIMDNDERP